MQNNDNADNGVSHRFLTQIMVSATTSTDYASTECCHGESYCRGEMGTLGIIYTESYEIL